MPTLRELKLKKKPLSITKIKKEHKQMLKAMDAIRFLAFKHEVAYWSDALGTDAEKLRSILNLARSSNWRHDGTNESEAIKKAHGFKK